MTPLQFLRLPEVRRTLELAQQSSGLPLSVHGLDHGNEGLRVCGWGGCAVCAQVAALPSGRAKCRESRGSASARAVSQGRTVAFVCHAGLSSVSFPLMENAQLAVTMGPFVPDGMDTSLEEDVQEALRPWAGEEISVSLSDLRRMPVSASAAAAAWLKESLDRLWLAQQGEAHAEEVPPIEVEGAAVRVPRKTKERGGASVEQLALLLAGRNLKAARKLLLDLTEAGSGRVAMRRSKPGARVVSLCAAVLEAGGRAGLSTDAASSLFAERMPLIQGAATAAASVTEAMAVLRLLCPSRKRSAAPRSFEALDAYLSTRLPERVTLNEVAEALGESPTAITHRLQRKFGFSYSEYVGRLRVEQAKRLLRRTQLSASEIARRVGIGDQSYFSKVFKRHEGVSPSEYRESYRKR